MIPFEPIWAHLDSFWPIWIHWTLWTLLYLEHLAVGRNKFSRLKIYCLKVVKGMKEWRRWWQSFWSSALPTSSSHPFSSMVPGRYCQKSYPSDIPFYFVGKPLPRQAMDRFDLHQSFLLSDPNHCVLLLATYQLRHLRHLWHQNDNKAYKWRQRRWSFCVFLCLHWLRSHLCCHRFLPLECRLVFQVLGLE